MTISDKTRDILEWVLCIVIAFVLAIIVKYFVGTPTIVSQVSMKPTLMPGQRLILTFDGDNPFMLIEETIAKEKEHLIVPTYGDLELMASTVAIVNENSVNWIDNNIEYYVVSDKLSKQELLNIARSISVLPVSK